MFVITVVPLRRGVLIDSLSYFSSVAYEPGQLVTVPVRTASVLALVTETREVGVAKTALRAATFSLKKLPPQTDVQKLGDAYIQTARALSLRYATKLGSILYNLLPPEVRNGEVRIPHTHHITSTETHSPSILQAKRSERVLTFRSLVRETFARSGSVLIVAPSSVEVDTLKAELGHGIEDRVITMTTAHSATHIKHAFRALEDFSRTQLIITTPTYALIERHDILTVILEGARSSYYKEMNRPYLDYRDVLVEHARVTGRKCILADALLRTEDEAKRREESYTTFGTESNRIELPSTLTVIDTSPKDSTSPTHFSLFAEETLEAIRDTRKKRGRVLLFAARRGLAPLVACADCGHIFRSKECGAPYTLIRTHTKGIEERWFVCSTTGERIRAYDTCTVCGSWRLRERGIGIQQVYDEFRALFPQVPIVLFDHQTAKTYKRALYLRDSFYGERATVLLGTHMVLPYLTESVELSVVVNMDALLSTPTWRIEEENLSLLLRLRELTSEQVIVQTRTPDAPVLAHARYGYTEQFYTEELELRKKFGYPPYSVFVHLTWQGTEEAVKSIEREIRTTLSEFNLSVYQSPTASKQNPLMYGLIRVPANTWPNPALASKLQSISPVVRVMINPDRIV